MMKTDSKRGWSPKFIFSIATLLVWSVIAQAADVKKIMPVGDSITRGWLGSTNHWGYRKPLYDNLTGGGYSFGFVGSKFDGSFPDPNHEGHDGWRADEILNGRTSEPNAGKIQDWMNAYQPHIVLLHIGTNDITAGNQDANEINAILNVIDAYEISSGQHVTVILALIINRATHSLPTTLYNNDVNNMALNRIASGDDVVIVDMENALNYSTDMYDNLHPNDSGYTKMANVWYNALTGVPVRQRTLTCSSTEGGTVTQPGEGAFNYDEGAIVNISAGADINYFFVNWTGTAVDAGKVADADSSSTTVTEDDDYTVIANFAQNGENRLEEMNQRLELRTNGDINDFAAFCTGHWKMNDNAASTVVLNSSGNGKNGTAQQNTSVLHIAGKIDGALTFNGTSDYVNLGNVVGTGAYTKVAWVNRADGNNYNNIVSSGNNTSHALYAPSSRQFRLCAGHVNPFDVVKDTEPLAVGVWYQAAVTFDPAVGSGRMVLYKNGVEVNEANGVQTQGASTSTYAGRFSTGYYFNGAIDNVMIFSKALTPEQIATLYNQGNGTEELPGGGQYQASYVSNGWNLDVEKDLEVKVDFHYSDISMAEGWIGMSIGDDANYVSISAGADSDQPYFYYEAAVDGGVVFEREARTSNTGTLYISFNSTLKEFYLSHTGFGSENAYIWQTPDTTRGQWALPVDVFIGGGSSGAVLGPGAAYLDNFQVVKADLLGWPPATDIDENGYIEIHDLALMCENWLEEGAGDIDDSGKVDLLDFAEFGLVW